VTHWTGAASPREFKRDALAGRYLLRGLAVRHEGGNRVPTPADIAHLLRRAGFGGTTAQINTLAAQPLETTVDQLLDFSGAPADAAPAFLADAEIGDWEKEYLLQHWWLDRMATTPSPLQEKLTLFWHWNLATENDKVGDASLVYRQNALYRRHATGNFRTLIQEMSIEPAMLIYLDNDPNTKYSPNENFARELMELFTLGVDRYTQDDVVAAARAWSGHNTLDDDRTQYHFYPTRHDYDLKTFMGVTRAWDGPDIVNFLLAENPTTKRIAASFIAGKLWGFLAYPDPEPELLDALTTEFHDSDLDVGVLVRAILLRPEFYSAKAKQGLVRTPVEWVVAVMRAVGMNADQTDPQWWMAEMGQQLFEPPNVSGWRPNGYWLGTTSLWARADWARHVSWKARQNGFLAGTKTMAVPDAVQAGFDAFMIDQPSGATRADLEAWLTAERADGPAWDDWAVLNLMTLVMLSPDFNLA
jgi:uncharacterized protein (DUF1800 family)